MCMKTEVREALANNVKKLMEGSGRNGSTDLRTQAKLAARCARISGKSFSQRTIGYLLRPDPSGKNQPKLDTIVAIAEAFKVEPWRLLHPTMGSKIQDVPELIKRYELASDKDKSIVQQVLEMEPVSDETVAKHLKPAPSVIRRSRHNS